MPRNLIKNGFVALLLTGTTFLVACSSNSTQTTKPTATEVNRSPEIAQDKDMMENGSGMDHSMSMDMGPANAEYDLRFIDAMRLHHQGAVDMAQEALAKSQRLEIKQLAQEIIAAQKREIEQMNQWQKAWYPKASDTPIAWQTTMNHSMAMTKEQMQSMMMSMDLGEADADFDLRFIDTMIPHHEGALVMAEDALSKSQRTEIIDLAQNILTSQKQEIDQMKAWRKAWYAQ
jgi:uncharacterized protein (DUF305 family)